MEPTTERREAVIDALIRTHDVSEDGDISFAAMADAAIAAVLPEPGTGGGAG